MKSRPSEAQLVRWRREASDKLKRSSVLSKRFGHKIAITDLNPRVTSGRSRRIGVVGTIDLRKSSRDKTIYIDDRVPKRFQSAVIKHELTHVKNPRKHEKTIERLTKEKHGFKNVKLHSGKWSLV